MKKGGRIMPKLADQRDAAMYATNLVIPKVHLDPETGLQHPTEQDIADAKRHVDDNEL